MKYFKLRLYRSAVNFYTCTLCNKAAGYNSLRGWLYLDDKSYYTNNQAHNTILHNKIQTLLQARLADQPENFNEKVSYIRLCPNCKGYQYGPFGPTENSLNAIVTIKRC